MTNLVPLVDLPKGCLKAYNDDASILKTLAATATREMGYFLVRYEYLKIPSATFVLQGDLRYAGRWMLGRIRQHKTQPGRFEILVRRSRTCYYLPVDTAELVGDEIHFMQQDADAELLMATESVCPWIITYDDEFNKLGFSTDNTVYQIGH